jgi:N-acylneuraminate cytidylyltransferase
MYLTKLLWTDNTFGLEVNELEVQDIDNEADWKIAEMKFKLIKEVNCG